MVFQSFFTTQVPGWYAMDLYQFLMFNRHNKYWFYISVDCSFLIVSFIYTDVHMVSQVDE
jgi:hypothetical protein